MNGNPLISSDLRPNATEEYDCRTMTAGVAYQGGFCHTDPTAKLVSTAVSPCAVACPETWQRQACQLQMRR